MAARTSPEPLASDLTVEIRCYSSAARAWAVGFDPWRHALLRAVSSCTCRIASRGARGGGWARHRALPPGDSTARPVSNGILCRGEQATPRESPPALQTSERCCRSSLLHLACHPRYAPPCVAGLCLRSSSVFGVARLAPFLSTGSLRRPPGLLVHPVAHRVRKRGISRTKRRS